MTKTRVSLLCGLLLLSVDGLSADRGRYVAQGVESETYLGWRECLSLNAPDRKIKAVVAPAVGGRIIYYGQDGDNLLWEGQDAAGKTLSEVKRWFAVGGYQLDVGPDARNQSERIALLLGSHRSTSPDDYQVSVVSDRDSTLGVQLEKEYLIDPESGDLGINQRAKNTSDHEIKVYLQDRTACRPEGFVIVPLSKKSRFPMRWCRYATDGQAAGPAVEKESPAVRVMGNVLVIKPGAEAMRLGADSDAGWVAYASGRFMLVKWFPVFPGGAYTRGGNSVEVYFDHQFVEFGPISPEATLKPGESHDFPEKWVLIPLKREVSSFEQAKSLEGRIPKSPFGAH